MIRFDFDDRYRDEEPTRTLPWIVRVAIAHFAFDAFMGIVVLPWLIVLALLWPEPDQTARPREQPANEPFVFVETVPQLPPEVLRPRAAPSDLDRRAQSPERPPKPETPTPFSRGNTPERVDGSPAQPPRGDDVPPEPPQPPAPQPPEQIARNTNAAPIIPEAAEPRRRPGSILNEAVRNIGRYAQNQTFSNPQGGANDPGSTIQFDTKGVDFGPWLRRFVGQVKRNWFVPLSAMNFRGHVVLQFNIHRDGRITDVNIVKPSEIESFNRAAFNAIVGSNPTEPLPPEYPDDKAFFTVTFYYNETPPGS